MAPRTRVGFIEPMLLLRTDKLPDDPARWSYQLKLDGYRAIAFKTGSKVHLRSRNDNDFSARYPKVVRGLAKLPNETVIDGELIALADDGRPSFNALQNYGSASTPILYFVFDVLVLEGCDLTGETFDRRAKSSSGRSRRLSPNQCGMPAHWTRAFRRGAPLEPAPFSTGFGRVD